MKNVSVTITEPQKEFLENHPKFVLSKFVRLTLNEFMELTKQNTNINVKKESN